MLFQRYFNAILTLIQRHFRVSPANIGVSYLFRESVVDPDPEGLEGQYERYVYGGGEAAWLAAVGSPDRHPMSIYSNYVHIW